MTAQSLELYILGDLARDERFREFTRRQIEYAIQEHKIKPARRVGIIRAFGEHQLPLILSAVRRTAPRN